MKSNSLPLATPRVVPIQNALSKLQSYWKLLKDLQTGLLLVTAVAGYMSACCINLVGGSLVSLLGTLFLTIGGSTVLNMSFDRDIDAKMNRTANRPIPVGRVTPREAWILGSLMISGGLLWSTMMSLLYAAVIASGVFLDVVIYTIWLKRRTPFAIIFGGLSGGMPALAGRTLALGHLDILGILLAIGILLWIPTHIMTFSIKYQADYANASVPTFPSRYGVPCTRWIIAASTLMGVGVLSIFGGLMHLYFTSLLILYGLGMSLMVLVILSIVKPSKKLNFVLYKGASLYMLFSMLLIIAGGI
jgi:protoheme IX farnesyltransferase